MGTYLNPGNSGFTSIVNSGYVDKTGMIALINQTIDTTRNLICVSRPRRFGKSYAARMLCAYYDRTCDSNELFDSFKISNDLTYEQHINHYHVINLDVSGFISDAKMKGIPLRDIPSEISRKIRNDIILDYPEAAKFESLNDCILALVRKTGNRIVFIIDEWDAMIRETTNDIEAQNRYLNLLRGWFNNNNFT